jgi:hypothetical protein
MRGAYWVRFLSNYEASMNKDDERKPQPGNDGDTGAKGGKQALRHEEQQPQGVEPDGEVDEQLRRRTGPPLGGLNPNSLVRN